MVQEYLFTSKENKESLQEMLKDYEDVETEIEEIEGSDCWVAKIHTGKNNERTARALSALNNNVVEGYHPVILTNESSAYFNKSLFPDINEFERKLRKLLYLKSALDADHKGSDVIKDLEEKELGVIFELLFTDRVFNTDLKIKINSKSWQFTKQEIQKLVQDLSENTLWDNLLGANAVPTLRTKFIEIKNFRNDVMHAHNMDAKAYSAAKRLFEEVNAELDAEIGEIISDTDIEDIHGDNSRRAFNSLMHQEIRNMYIPYADKKIRELHSIATCYGILQRYGLNQEFMNKTMSEIYAELAKKTESVGVADERSPEIRADNDESPEDYDREREILE